MLNTPGKGIRILIYLPAAGSMKPWGQTDDKPAGNIFEGNADLGTRWQQQPFSVPDSALDRTHVCFFRFINAGNTPHQEYRSEQACCCQL